MSAIKDKVGIAPELRKEIAVRDAAMAGDIVAVISPATVDQVPTDAAWTRSVVYELRTSDGRLHDWLTKSFATSVSIADDSVAGAASIASTTLAIVKGSAVITVNGDEADWLADETNTLTIAAITVLGVQTAQKTSVGTFVAPVEA